MKYCKLYVSGKNSEVNKRILGYITKKIEKLVLSDIEIDIKIIATVSESKKYDIYKFPTLITPYKRYLGDDKIIQYFENNLSSNPLPSQRRGIPDGFGGNGRNRRTKRMEPQQPHPLRRKKRIVTEEPKFNDDGAEDEAFKDIDRGLIETAYETDIEKETNMYNSDMSLYDNNDIYGDNNSPNDYNRISESSRLTSDSDAIFEKMNEIENGKKRKLKQRFNKTR